MESKEEMSVKLLCMACLCFGRNLRELKDEKLKQYYLDVLSEVPLFSTLPVSPIVCWECEAFLRKALSFKEQCKDSYRILQTYTNEDLKERLFTEVMCQPALKVHKQESISIKPEESSWYANDEGMFVYAGVKNEENSSCCCGSQAANACKKRTKMYENDIFKEETNELNEVGNDFDEPDVLSASNEKDFSVIAMASKQNCVYVKEESKKTMEIGNGLDNVLQDDNEGTSRLLEIEVPVPPSIDGKEDKKRKKKTNRVKKKVKNNKENLKQRRLSVDTCQLDTQKLESTNDEIVDGIFSYGDVKMEERSSSVINKANDQPKDDYIDSDEKLMDFKAEIHHLDEFDNDFEDLGALNIKDEGTTKIVGIEVALKTLIGDKDTKRKKLNRVKGRKRLKEKKKKVTTQILTVDMTYEEMLRERDVEGGRERYLKSEYKCESCLLGFSHEGAYREHNRRRHDKALGDYSCPICKTVIPSVDSFTAHYKRHTRRYECAICHKRTLDLKVMQQHYYSNHEIALKEYKCSVCGKISKSIEAHRYHKDSHKARIQCPECEKTYRHRAGLMNHRVAVHEFRNAFPCNKCDKVFRWKTSLKRHLEKHEVKAISNPAPAFCSLCNVSFASISSYQRHLKNSLKHVTQDQLKYICDHCNRRFADKTKLRDHIEEKHLYRTFQCHICLKPSKNRVGLDQHIRNVHKGRPHNAICHFCGKRFPTRVQLESHVRTHTGERPFICEYCPTTFSQQSNLYKHNRQVHLNIKSKKFPMCRKRKEDRPQVVENPTAGDAFTTPMAVWRYSPQRGIIM